MKLIVQIPCFNEEATLAATVADIPRSIPGVDLVEVLVIDDGSTDRTAAVALMAGAEYVVHFPANRGLGHAFAAGIDRCLMLGADIIVNTDGDNQYAGKDIPKLIQPIVDGKADMVIGDREPAKIVHFSFVKKLLQKLGSCVVSRLAGIDVPDVTSGFRAYSREAAARLLCSTDFDHTVDHVIQAGRKGLGTCSVPVGTNSMRRQSRLFSNLWVFVARSLGIMVRVYSSYRAMTIFTVIGLITAGAGFVLGLRFLYYFFIATATRDVHIQSLILAAILLLAGFQMILTGIVADLIGVNRSILEDVSYRLRRLETRKKKEEHDE
jgi:glycosyltransferase involved in cell wall biosynthesis